MASKRTVKSSMFCRPRSLSTVECSANLFSINNKRLTGSSGEVFQKAVLSLSSDIPKDTKSKQKRKERLAKPKSTGQKVRCIEKSAV